MKKLIFRQTSLKRLLRCPYKFYLRNILRVRVPISSYAFLGGTIHLPLAENAAQKIATRKDLPLEQVLTSFIEAFDAKRFLSLPLEDEPAPEGIIWEEPQNFTRDVGLLLLKTYHYPYLALSEDR